MGLPGSVMMFYELNTAKVNCDALFNLVCPYANPIKIKFVTSKPGMAMVQVNTPTSRNFLYDDIRLNILARPCARFCCSLALASSLFTYAQCLTLSVFSLTHFLSHTHLALTLTHITSLHLPIAGGRPAGGIELPLVPQGPRDLWEENRVCAVQARVYC